MHITCETAAAITTHLRWLDHDEKPNYSGSTGNKFTLCGMRVGWDLKFNQRVRCKGCIEVLKKKQ